MTRPIEKVRYGVIDTDFVDQMLARSRPADGPVLMLNLMRYRERADYPDDGGEAPDISGREADDRYSPLGVLADIGAEVVLFAEVAAQSGDDAWERVAVVRYPTFCSFVEMQERPDFLAAHRHKEAGMDQTIIAACRPESGSLVAPAARAGMGLRLDLYAAAPTAPAAPPSHGARWQVDGCPVGDGRSWSAVDLTPVHLAPADQSAPLPAASGRLSLAFTPLLDRLDEQ